MHHDQWPVMLLLLKSVGDRSFCVFVAQSCVTLFDPMNHSWPCSSNHGISQARILEWVAMPFSRGSSRPRDWTWVSCIADACFTVWTTRQAHWTAREVSVTGHYTSLIQFWRDCKACILIGFLFWRDKLTWYFT